MDVRTRRGPFRLVGLLTAALALSAMAPVAAVGVNSVQQQKLTTSDGSSPASPVAISGNTIVVGTPSVDAAYVFTRTRSGWIETAKLTASDGTTSFGNAVAISGNVVVVGADAADHAGANAGAAYVFTRTRSGWVETAILTASDAVPGDFFGSAVGISGSTIVVGAQDADFLCGAAYVFTRSRRAWRESAKLVNDECFVSDNFGWSAAVDGGTIVIGAPNATVDLFAEGAAFVFSRTGSDWVKSAKLIEPDADRLFLDNFGISVDVSGDTIVVGQRAFEEGGIPAQAHVFTRNGASWEATGRLAPSDAEIIGGFSQSVAISGDIVVVGADDDDTAGEDAGAAYAYRRTPAGWIELAKLTAQDGADGDDFGRTVAVDGQTIVIGTGTDAAYVFTP